MTQRDTYSSVVSQQLLPIQQLLLFLQRRISFSFYTSLPVLLVLLRATRYLPNQPRTLVQRRMVSSLLLSWLVQREILSLLEPLFPDRQTALPSPRQLPVCWRRL